MITAVQTSQADFTSMLTGALDAYTRARLTDTAVMALEADLYPIFFTRIGLPRIYGNSDHHQHSVLQWDCECGEVFSTTFDGRDEMHAHRALFFIDGPRTRAQTEQTLQLHLGATADAIAIAERLYAAIGLDEIDLSF